MIKNFINTVTIAIVLGFGGQVFAEKKSVDVRDFRLDAGARLGGAFVQDGTNSNFNAIGLLGVGFGVPFLQFSGGHRLGPTFGYFKYTTDIREGTETTWTTTNYRRFDLLASWIWNYKYLELNGGIGAGFMIIGTENVHQDDQYRRVETHYGGDVGFLANLGIGLELGKTVLKIDRRFVIGVQSEWLTRNHRDEFTMFGIIIVSLFD